ncbi:hypothetical protein AGMMS49938_03330 [Fibrobacterales bacterium]|nr:hypothetical protein AGMMS49938_03330 [Fibrobacterales bacterium]
MERDKNITLEFPANKDNVPVVQEFIRDTLLVARFKKEFADSVIKESSNWFLAMIDPEKELNLAHFMTLRLSYSEDNFSISIKTSEGKEFNTSFDARTNKDDSSIQ